MKIFVFGSSLTSTYWNGAATYYRGIYKNLSRLGYEITFAEPAIYDRQEHADSADIQYAKILVYHPSSDIPQLLREAERADVVIKHSGVGAEDDRLEREVLGCGSRKTRVVFWDVDAPATLERVRQNPRDPFLRLVRWYDAVFTYGGGNAVVEEYQRLGAKLCIPVYNALDPETHFPTGPDSRFCCDLAFIGHRLPDREWRVENFFLGAAAQAPELSFLLGGEGWGDKALPSNVRWIGHVGSDRHNRVNCSARMVLNVNRESMAKAGFSPPTRVFEAAGAGACVITDFWTGIEHFFTPNVEILVANSGREVVELLRRFNRRESAKIGCSMLCRALREHTYASRANEVHDSFQALFSGKPTRKSQDEPKEGSRSSFISA